MIHNEERNQSVDIDPRLTHMVQLKNNKKLDITEERLKEVEDRVVETIQIET